MPDDDHVSQIVPAPGPGLRRYFTQIPHIVTDDTRLTLADFRLYVHYVRVCGLGSGACYQSAATIEAATGVSARQQYLSRARLAECGYVTVEERFGRSVLVQIIDVWDENMRQISLAPMSGPRDEEFWRSEIRKIAGTSSGQWEVDGMQRRDFDSAWAARNSQLTHAIDGLLGFDAPEYIAVDTVLAPITPQESVNSGRYIPRAVRELVFARDSYTCTTCGAMDRLSIDHIIPLALGGSGETSNLQTLCLSCNSRKGSRI